jgi:2-keto-3-deoxy-L-rhamnonate aldolase RhmA
VSTESRRATFRQRLRARTQLVGTWVKTPSPIVCEVLCRSELDLLALDAEHAPFGRSELDACLAICRALDMPALVRVPAADPALILNALDCGASGVLVSIRRRKPAMPCEPAILDAAVAAMRARPERPASARAASRSTGS